MRNEEIPKTQGEGEDASSKSCEPVTAGEYISSQLDLEREARDLMPYDPNCCTYLMGETRQQLYACLTCSSETGKPAGVCYSCSIKCHSTHDLVELFTKRNFTCDCGTTRTNHPCSLRNGVSDNIPSSTNEYNQNFKGVFCDCHEPYNPTEETGNMLQCVFGDICGEDWYHDYCILGVAKPVKNHADGVNILDSLGDPGMDANEDNKNKQNDTHEQLDELPLPGFPALEEFDCYVCWKCIARYKEFFNLIKDNESIVARVVSRIKADNPEMRLEIIDSESTQALKKRKIDRDYSLFLKPNYEKNFQSLLASSSNETIQNFLKTFKFLTEDDPIYEPPPDGDDDNDDDNSSIFNLGAKAINSLPREQAIQGVQAYEDIKQKLKSFLAPFAENGKIVDETDIKDFFKSIKK